MPALRATVQVKRNFLLRIALNALLTILLLAGLPAHQPVSHAQAGGTVYYVDSSLGSDDYNGLSPDTPWRSIERINAQTYNGGDMILFRRGAEWRGGLRLLISGGSEAPLTVGAYGEGANPVLNGAMPVGGPWTRFTDPAPGRPSSASIYFAAMPFPVSQLLGDDQRLELARAPDSGYFRISQAVSATAIGAPDAAAYFDGSTATRTKINLKLRDWHVDTRNVIAFDPVSRTLTWNGVTKYPPSAGYGYFLSNSLSLLNRAGEWYYDPDAQLLFVWLPGSEDPSSHRVEASVLPYGIFCDSPEAQLRVDGLNLKNFAIAGIWSRNSGLEVYNSAILNSNERAIYSESKSVMVSSNIISTTNADGIWVTAANNVVIQGNAFRENGYLGTQRNPGQELNAMRIGRSVDVLVANNTVERAGYAALTAGAIGRSLIVKENWISGTCLYLNDCGAIYINATDMTATTLEISSNTIRDTFGDPQGTTTPNSPKAAGIYLDLYASDFLVFNNFIDSARGALGAVSINGGNNNRIFQNGINQHSWTTMGFSKYRDGRFSPPQVHPMSDNVVEDNELFVSAILNESLNMRFVNEADSDHNFGTFRNNTLRLTGTRPPRGR